MGTPQHQIVTANQLYRQWQDKVRGRVGALVRGPWWIIRGAVSSDELMAMYILDMAPQAAAVKIAAAWLEQTPAQMQVHRERIRAEHDGEAVKKFDRAVSLRRRADEKKPNTEADWNRSCIVCGQKPVVGDLELCGPCCFGEAATAGGNW